MIMRLRGGGGPQEQLEMNLAAGGLINQTIIKDSITSKWNKAQTMVFNVQILNSNHFRHITGISPLPSPVSAETYFEQGYPLFEIYEEPSTIAGDFALVKSVGQIDGTSDPNLK